MKKCGVKYPPQWLIGDDATTHLFDDKAVVCLSAAGKSKLQITGLLVHEAVHVFQYHMERIHETRPGDEQMAYGIQIVSMILIDAYKRRKKV